MLLFLSVCVFRLHWRVHRDAVLRAAVLVVAVALRMDDVPQGGPVCLAPHMHARRGLPVDHLPAARRPPDRPCIVCLHSRTAPPLTHTKLSLSVASPHALRCARRGLVRPGALVRGRAVLPAEVVLGMMQANASSRTHGHPIHDHLHGLITYGTSLPPSRWSSPHMSLTHAYHTPLTHVLHSHSLIYFRPTLEPMFIDMAK